VIIVPRERGKGDHANGSGLKWLLATNELVRFQLYEPGERTKAGGKLGGAPDTDPALQNQSPRLLSKEVHVIWIIICASVLGKLYSFISK
jgi:hypothetical protein